MPLIRPSSTALVDKQPMRLDLGDLYRQGERIIADARAEADKIVAAAKAERDRLLSDAAAKGRADGQTQGRTEGIQAGRTEGKAAALAEFKTTLDQLQGAWLVAAEDFLQRRDDMLLEAKTDVLRVAAEIARMVTKRAIALDPTLVQDQLTAALAQVSRPTRLLVAVHPDDAPVVRDALPELAERLASTPHAELVDDAALARGSVVVRLASGAAIDASIDAQLNAIVALLLPSP
jgi:flagellar assembly protein FliH